MRDMQIPIIFAPSKTTDISSDGIVVKETLHGFDRKPYTLDYRSDGVYWNARNRISVKSALQGPHKNAGLAVIAFNKWWRGK